MRKTFFAGIICICFLAEAARAEPLDLSGILEDYARLDSLYEPMPFSTHMVSTHDPEGLNRDQDNFREKSDRKALLADVKGPGVITRIYCADPNGIIKIYIDGSEAPIVSANVSDFFAGRVKPFLPPLVGNDPAGISYFPIPFASRARIEIEALPKDSSARRFGYFWQVEWLEAPADFPIKGLALPLSEKENASLQKLDAFLAGLARFDEPAGVEHLSFEKELTPGAKTELTEIDGPGVVRKIGLSLTPEKGDLEQLLAPRLLCFWDGEQQPSVSASVGAFFGNSFDQNSPRLLLRRIDKGGESYIPMPFSKSARFEIDNAGSFSGKARIDIFYEKLPQMTSPFRFHAFERAQKLQAFPGRNPDHLHDYLVLNARGRGRYLGTSLTVLNRYMIWWGEGNESLELDGRLDWVGTGTEDYFDGAYMQFGKGLFAGALVANSFHKKYSGVTDAYKFHLLDPVYFDEALKFQLEHGRVGNDLANWYRSVAYWYQTEPHSDFSIMQGDQLDLSRASIKGEINRELWKALPSKNKFAILAVWAIIVGSLLLLVLLVPITIWSRSIRKRGRGI